MNRSKDAYHHGNLRSALVASAVRLIEQGGSEGFSLREAAREVGVSANAAYRHFEDKSALLTAATAIGFERLSKRMQRAMAHAAEGAESGRTAVARFKAVGTAYVEFAVDHPELFRVMFGPSGVSCIHAAPVGLPKQAEPTPYDLLGRALDELVAEGVLVATRRPGAELKAWTVVHGFASLALDGALPLATRHARSEALTSVLEFAVAGLCWLSKPLAPQACSTRFY